jgi:uncharacterized protein
MIRRFLSKPIRKQRKSILLLGPRQTGKSTLMLDQKPDLHINLADEVEFLNHSANPDEIRSLLSLSGADVVFIDEVQRLPSMLNTIQSIVDHNPRTKFLLTGSSTRKLKRGGANLLPGRVLNYQLGALVAAELDYRMDTKRVLGYGALPEPYLEPNRKSVERLLISYVANYLREEIQAEALTRNLDSFSRFLNEAVLLVGQFIDFTKLARRARISRHAAPRYFEILEDTLIGYRIYPLRELTESEDLIRHPKFFLFDTGVLNGLLRNFIPSVDRAGVLAETLVFSQIVHSAAAWEKHVVVSSFRTRKGVEVDFIVDVDGRRQAIEVKNSSLVTSHELDGLLYFKGRSPKASLFIFHMETKEKRIGPVWILPWQKGLREIGL